MVLPNTNSTTANIGTDFSSAEYWSKRFDTEASFEWLVSDEKLLCFIEDNLPPSLLTQEQDQDQEETDTEDHDNGKVTDGGMKESLDGRTKDTVNVDILHFGSGTSSLGSTLHRHLNDTNLSRKRKLNLNLHSNFQVYDSDYVPLPKSVPVLSTSTTSATPSTITTNSVSDDVPFILQDVLSIESLLKTLPKSLCKKWDLLIDKSTSDAISCSSHLPNHEHPIYGESPVDPVERLAWNLSKVTGKGARWISISYSTDRYNFISSPKSPPSSSSSLPPARFSHTLNIQNEHEGKQIDFGWKVLSKKMIDTTYIPSGRIIKDPKSGMERVVHEPETGVWAYVLERT
ncbi:uncharacterized protein IL334_004568 [Kwoniella shivajii]|uniref:Methyltransferase type 11 domain-containing protein n=1 Tax=Kwoniella shivajii TaxID=564305 RepID=A0ABZ1D3P5_9TREE|nr:hypothetical protein IL334_004568 [Kwoniella shivajii]